MNRPVILIGAGCPHSLAEKLCAMGVPVLTTWQGIDLVPEDSPVFCGRPGVIGQRAANIIQQSATHLFIFGARMDPEQVGHQMGRFAPGAVKHAYDVDLAELEKLPQDWQKHLADLRDGLALDLADLPFLASPIWLTWCRTLYAKFRLELNGANLVEDFVDPYFFVRVLSDACLEGEIIVPGSSGMQSCALLQAFKVKRDQRILVCNTIGAMGLEPMAIGAAIGAGKRVICVTGDGGFFLNFQELEVVRRLDLTIKYFLFANGGYGSISTMQDARFNLRVGADPASGFTLPDLARTAAVWGFPFHVLKDNGDVAARLESIVSAPNASITEVHTSLAFKYAVKVQSALKGAQFVNDDMADMTPKIPDLEEMMKWES